MNEYINQIIEGNCINIMDNFDSNSIDLTVTSPPYDNLRVYQGYHFSFEDIAQGLWRVTNDLTVTSPPYDNLRVYQGYHFSFEDIAQGLWRVTNDLTVTSPPYDNLRVYQGYHFSFEDIAQGLWRVTKKGGIVVWVVGDATIKGSETGTSFKQALYFKEIGFNLHDTMIFQKKTLSRKSIESDITIPLNTCSFSVKEQ